MIEIIFAIYLVFVVFIIIGLIHLPYIVEKILKISKSQDNVESQTDAGFGVYDNPSCRSYHFVSKSYWDELSPLLPEREVDELVEYLQKRVDNNYGVGDKIILTAIDYLLFKEVSSIMK